MSVSRAVAPDQLRENTLADGRLSMATGVTARGLSRRKDTQFHQGGTVSGGVQEPPGVRDGVQPFGLFALLRGHTGRYQTASPINGHAWSRIGEPADISAWCRHGITTATMYSSATRWSGMSSRRSWRDPVLSTLTF